MTQKRETRLLNEYVDTFYPTDVRWKNVRLGQLPAGETSKMFKVVQHYADAIVLHGTELIIIEAKIEGEVGAISQLELYGDLLRHTPEFSRYWGNPIRLLLLVAREDLNVRALCKSKDIDYIVFSPAWVQEYIRQRRGLPPGTPL